MIRRTTAALLAAMAPMLIAVQPVSSAPPAACTPVPSVAPGPIPPDVVACHSPTPQLDAFADLAWQAFKMIVWPAARSSEGVPKRGEPDLGRSLGDMQGPRVFETYKADWETFLASAEPPLEWNRYPATASPCKNNPPIAAGTLVLASLAEFGNVDQPGGTSPSGKPITNVLVGQNRKIARYLVGFDRIEFDLIRTNRLYDARILPAPGPMPGPMTTPSNGAIVVKSAWLELDGLNVDPATFYHRRALVQDFDLNCREADVGLVGLHIRYKTPTRPQWIWASFEHVRNVPPTAPGPGNNGAHARAGYPTYTFNDGSGTPMPDQPPPDTQIGSDHFSHHPAPYNVQRLKLLAPGVETANGNWQAALAGTVWTNYELVIVEWPGIASDFNADALQALPDPPSFTDDQSNLVNTTMETFLQSRAGHGTEGIHLTCMGCHNSARTYDYVFTIPINATSSGDRVAPSLRRTMIEILTSIVDAPKKR